MIAETGHLVIMNLLKLSGTFYLIQYFIELDLWFYLPPFLLIYLMGSAGKWYDRAWRGMIGSWYFGAVSTVGWRIYKCLKH